MNNYIGNIKESISQLMNTILFGLPDEMLSARLYRTNSKFVSFIDFFLGKGHCKEMYEYEFTRKSQPSHYHNK